MMIAVFVKMEESVFCTSSHCNVLIVLCAHHLLLSLVLVALTGLSLSAMWTCVSHSGYFVLCAVLLTFLRCPGFSRAMLLLTVPLNAVAEVNQQPALDLCSLSLLLLALSLGKST